MSDLAISVENLSKAYRIGLKERQHETLLGAMAAWVKSPFTNFRDVRNLSRFDAARNQPQVSGSIPQPSNDVFWALKDVSFDVKKGEAIGIIGRNGAGKSTLLKILSRITEPTSGRAKIYGRVASLLEVGTGFHPDLTGRENTYLNGTILGMRKSEIDRKFDEIVNFSGVETFIDTPVKRYSSGMRVRLAFAVAAHLEPEILIVDEVLAVGDAEFQRKCLGKMGEVATGGRTVMFVSHNMAAVTNLCKSIIVLSSGEMALVGPPEDAVNYYLRLPSPGQDGPADGKLRPAWAVPCIENACLLNHSRTRTTNFLLGDTITIEMRFRCRSGQVITQPIMGVVVKHPVFGVLGGVNMRMTASEPRRGQYSGGAIECTLEQIPFLPGSYSVDVWLSDGQESVDSVEDILEFTIEPTDVYGTGKLPMPKLGVTFLRARWSARCT